MARTMAFRYSDGLLLVAHSAQSPSEADWAEYLRYCEHEMPRSCRRTLVLTRGGGPDAAQRKRVQTLIERISQGQTEPLRVAVVTDSTLVRGIVTALNWFNPHTRAFASAALPEALRYLSVPAGETAERLGRELRTLERQVGG